MNRTDTFNRADDASSLGTPSDGGSAWSALQGTWGISTDQAYCVADGGASNQDSAALDSGTSDVTLQITMSGVPTDMDAGLVARATDYQNYILLAIRGNLNGSPTLQIYAQVAGGFSSLGSYAGSLAANDVISFALSNTSLVASQNGTQRITASSSAGQTNTKHGLRVFNVAGHTAGTRFDDFSITDTGGGAGILYTQLERGTRGLVRGIYGGSVG